MHIEQNTAVAPRALELFQGTSVTGILPPHPEIIATNQSSGLPSEVKVAARKLRVLVVEDDPSDVELVLHALKTGGIHAEREIVQTAEEFTQSIRTNTYEVILADYRLPGWNGLDTVEILRREGLDIPVIVVSGALGELMAVECIKQGAADYLLKDHLPRLAEAVGRAIREKKLRDEHRRTLHELARSNRELEQFAYMASHDLQEPLRMVATYTQLLAERYRGKLDENAERYIHYAVDGALRMQTLVRDLLAFSRVGRGSEQQPTDCNLVLQSVIANLQATIQETAARIIYDDLPNVMANGSELVQLFQNFIGNAIKFRSSVPPEIRITAAMNHTEWLFSVADNGIGIAPEHAEEIFVIFRRLHTHQEYPGSGIGLAICKKIVEEYGGHIWVESQPGRGSKFNFTLPLKIKRGGYESSPEN
jgi:signal transduction histidine kinase